MEDFHQIDLNNGMQAYSSSSNKNNDSSISNIQSQKEHFKLSNAQKYWLLIKFQHRILTCLY